MKICIAQTKSLKGAIKKNINNHLRLVKSAIELEADLIVFPELSITSFEPTLAQHLATTIEDEVFVPFQSLASENDLTIGVGMPTKTSHGVHISMLIFRPNGDSIVYSKQVLHSDELPHFVCGNSQTLLEIKGNTIALGICYETMHQQHFLTAQQKGADIHIASVAKAAGGVAKAYSHYPKMATEFSVPVLMSNSVGDCDNFLSTGQSAAWNKKGELIDQLDHENQGLLIYDTETDKVEVHQLPLEFFHQ